MDIGLTKNDIQLPPSAWPAWQVVYRIRTELSYSTFARCRSAGLVRQYVEACNDEDMARCKIPTPDMKQKHKQQQQHQHGEWSSNSCAPSSTRGQGFVNSGNRSSLQVGSPQKASMLDKWRLPKEGREPSARPGVNAARRQAKAPCVRVGSRVSFNTVVAAILIPSAKDLHSAAREELW